MKKTDKKINKKTKKMNQKSNKTTNEKMYGLNERNYLKFNEFVK